MAHKHRHKNSHSHSSHAARHDEKDSQRHAASASHSHLRVEGRQEARAIPHKILPPPPPPLYDAQRARTAPSHHESKTEQGSSQEARKGVHFVPEQGFFMRIDRPLVFRRNLLEASKDTLSVLRGLYGLKEIREQKANRLTVLQHEVREIKLLLQKAEEMLPKYAKHEAAKYFPQFELEPSKQKKRGAKAAPTAAVVEDVPERAPEPKHEKKQTEEQIVVQRSLSELERLSASIDGIESKIKQLPDLKDFPPRARKEHEEPLHIEPREAKPGVKKRPEELGKDIGKTLESIHKKLKEL